MSHEQTKEHWVKIGGFFIESHLEKVNLMLDRISDASLRVGCKQFLEKYKSEFTTWPASIAHHNPESGGLLVHTKEVMELSLDIAENIPYPVDRDYLIASAFLHDFGKLEDYEEDEDSSYQTKNGFLRVFRYRMPRGSDHSIFPIINYPIVTGKALPPEVCHAILSHMGGWSKTSVFPETHLDGVLCAADLICTRVG